MVFPHYVPGAPLWYTVAGIGWHVVMKVFRIFDAAIYKSNLHPYRRLGPLKHYSQVYLEVRGPVSLLRDSDLHESRLQTLSRISCFLPAIQDVFQSLHRGNRVLIPGGSRSHTRECFGQPGGYRC